MTPQGSGLPPARAAALGALEKILPVPTKSGGKSGQDLQAALDQALRSVSDPRDKALATEITYGFLRLKGRMEHLAAAHFSKPEKTPPGLLRIVAVAAYELVHLDSVPPHATLSWAVDAVKSGFGQTQAGVANAVLRRIQALGADAASPAFYEASARSHEQFLSAWHSCPRWLVNLWLQQYGEQTTLALLQAQLQKPLIGVRINALHPGARDLFDTLSGLTSPLYSSFPWLGFGTAGSPLTARLVQAEQNGLLSRQSPAVGALLSQLGYTAWPGPIWDACAGRGGKSAALIEHGHAKLLSSDTNKRRLRGLIIEARRLRLPPPLAFLADAARPPLRKRPATILIDAPCSGLGVLARRPDAKWKRSPTDITTLAALQKRIIQAAAQLLPPGGLLVYMTCTMTREENDQQASFIESLDFTPEKLAQPAPGGDTRELFWGGVWRKQGLRPCTPPKG